MNELLLMLTLWDTIKYEFYLLRAWVSLAWYGHLNW